MTETKDVIIKTGLSRWLLKLTLVLTLITFSGHVYSVKPHNTESTRTELKLTSSVKSKRTVSYKTFLGGLRCWFLQKFSFTGKFIYGLLRYESIVKLKHRATSKELDAARKPVKNLRIVYSTDKPEEFHANKSRG